MTHHGTTPPLSRRLSEKNASRLVVLQLMLVVWLGTVNPSASAKEKEECPCKLLPKPDPTLKAETARWMAHSLDWGVLSTISTRLSIDGDNNVAQGFSEAVPFGNVYSFVDGTCVNSTGTLYFYGTYMDQSFLDTKDNAAVSFTLSEASLSSVCHNKSSLKACNLHGYGDPENPVCSRLTLSGLLQIVEDKTEYDMAKGALFERHTSMQYWPENHDWVVAKLKVQDVWLIDYFGGASVIPVQDYMAVQLTSTTAVDKFS